MKRSRRSQLAVDLYSDLQQHHSWTAATAWQGIARLLLSCGVYRLGWQYPHDVVTYVESNRFPSGNANTNTTLRRAEHLTAYLATQLNIPRRNLCQYIGLYWRQPELRSLQPNNLVGNAFRSLIADALRRFGDRGVSYEELPQKGQLFPEYSEVAPKRTNFDIVARRNGVVVAVLIVRWRVRHNGIAGFREAETYAPALARQSSNGKFYVVLGEFDSGRLRKVLDNCQPYIPHAALSAAVHFAPQLIREGLEGNGAIRQLRSLEWLIGETFRWQ